MSLAPEELPRGAAREELHEESQKTATNKPHTNRTPLCSVAGPRREDETRDRKTTYIYNYHHTLFFFTASSAESKNTSSWSP